MGLQSSTGGKREVNNWGEDGKAVKLLITLTPWIPGLSLLTLLGMSLCLLNP